MNSTMRAIVRLVTLHTDSEESETWEKRMVFGREPVKGEHIELWDGCAGLAVKEKSWTHRGDLVIWLQMITLGERPERPWDLGTEHRMNHWWRPPKAPTPETLTTGGWRKNLNPSLLND